MPHAKLFDLEDHDEFTEELREQLLAGLRERIATGAIDEQEQQAETFVRRVRESDLMECVGGQASESQTSKAS